MLVYGAGALGSLHAARLHEAGHDVALLARGERLAVLRRDGGVRLAEEDSPDVRLVPVPIVEQPDGGYDLTAVFVRAHQVESLAGVDGDVLFLLNWAGGAQPLSAVAGQERVLLGLPALGGRVVGDVVHYRSTSLMTRLVSMPIGEPDGRPSPRLDRAVQAFRSAGINARAVTRIEAQLRTHAAFVAPLGRSVVAAGGPLALADDPEAVRAMLRHMRHHLPATPVPRAYGVLRTLPEALMTAMLRRFLRSTLAVRGLGVSPTEAAEAERLTEQLR
jgi:2-dehydropantoate 2-reductase